MSIARSRFIKRCAEYLPISQVKFVPEHTRGVYSLVKQIGENRFEVIYVGKSGGVSLGIRRRLNSHKSKRSRKLGKWDHFCVYEVWDNISEIEIKELEGLIRHIYRKDHRVNILNKQRRFKPITKVKNNSLKTWH